MLNLVKFCCQKPKTLQTTLIWGEGGFFRWKINFLFCLNSFVQDCRLLIFFENYAPNCWMVLKCMLVHCIIYIQSSPSYKSDFYRLLLIFSIKICYFWRLLLILPNKTQKIVFIFFKTNPNVCIALKDIWACIGH